MYSHTVHIPPVRLAALSPKAFKLGPYSVNETRKVL
jgi:hypothetical protein